MSRKNKNRKKKSNNSYKSNNSGTPNQNRKSKPRKSKISPQQIAIEMFNSVYVTWEIYNDKISNDSELERDSSVAEEIS